MCVFVRVCVCVLQGSIWDGDDWHFKCRCLVRNLKYDKFYVNARVFRHLGHNNFSIEFSALHIYSEFALIWFL